MAEAEAPTDEMLVQAAEWFATLGGAPTPDERTEWRRWLDADSRHVLAWRRVEALSQRFQQLPAVLDRTAAAQALARNRAQPRRQALRALAGVGVLGAGGWLAQREQPWLAWQADVRTRVGEQRELRLADGTRLWLNTDTALQLQDSAEARGVRLLRGELMVATATANTSWRLDTPAGRLCPVGTRFAVRQQGEECSVSVFEGRVDVQPADAEAQVSVHAGRRLRFDRAAVREDADLPPAADAWTRGMLVVDGWTLAALCEELGRYQPGLLSCADAAAGLRVVGAFPLGDLDQVYRMLARTLPVEVQHPLPGWVRIAAA